MINDPGEVVIDEGAHALLGCNSTSQPGKCHFVVRREALDVETVSEVLFAAEVVVETADARSGTLENLIDGGIDNTLFEEQGQRSVQQSLPLPFGARCHDESLM